MKIWTGLVCFVVFLVNVTGCTSAQKHAGDVQQGLQGDKLTVGTVQREIKQGMSGGEVVQVLGSPNIVSTDEKNLEVWVYDKIATDTVYSNSSGGINSLVLAGGASVAGGISGNSRYASGASSTSQRTLTIIVKFDESKKVRDFSYHSSRF